MSILVASPARYGEDFPCISGLYEVKWDGQIYDAETGRAPVEPYYWIRESEVVEGVPCAY